MNKMAILKGLAFVTLLGAILLNFATHQEAAGSATTMSKPDTKVMDWTRHPKSKCSKETSTQVIEESDPDEDSEAARLLADSTSVPGWLDFIKDKLGVQKDAAAKYGFDVEDWQCRDRCKESAGCKFYSYGMWTKGWGPLFGGYYGKMRCQRYSSCDISTFIGGYEKNDGMDVFEKIWIEGKSEDVTTAAPDDGSTAAPTHQNGKVLAAVVLLTTLNVLVLGGFDWRAGTACSVLAIPVAVWLVLEAVAFQLLYLLAAVHALNIFGLLGVAVAGKPTRVAAGDGKTD